jgi:hypothetical protein
MPNLTPAALGQGFSQGISDFNNEQTAALNAQRAQIAKQQYEDSMKPIDIKEAFQGVPDFLQPTFHKLAKSQGIIEQNGNNVFIRKGKMQELQEGFAKNKVLQAGVLQEALQGLDSQNAELEKAGSQLKPVIDKFEESWKQRALKLKDKDGHVDAMKLQALEKERAEFMANSPEYQQYNQLSQVAKKNAVNKMKTLQFLGIIDDGFKKDAEKWGTEEAMKAATDVTYRQALIQRDRKAAAEAWLAPREALEKTKQPNRIALKETVPGGFTEKEADSQDKEYRREQIDVYDKAIDNYKDKITSIEKKMESMIPGTPEYAAYEKSLKDHEKQKDITMKRKEDFVRAKRKSSGGVQNQTEQGGNSFNDAVARLRANPQEASLFDQQFGKGMAAKYLKR